MLSNNNAVRREDSFELAGEYWAIVYNGAELRLRDSRGMRYLARLLGNAGREIPAAELIASLGGVISPHDTSTAERCRVAVTKRIRDAINKIDLYHPGLGHHLRTNIKTGYACTYLADPEHPPRWHVRHPGTPHGN